MELGCTVIDMGGGVTSMGIFFEGSAFYMDSVPVGGAHVTSDIARGLTTSMVHAERLKTLYGGSMSSAADEREIIDVPQVGEEAPEHANPIPKSELINIIRPRIEETFEKVRDSLDASGLADLGRRVVLTGGACQLPGVRDVAQRILGRPVRLGKPIRVNGLADATGGPAFATATGLLSYALHPEMTLPGLSGELSGGSSFFSRLGAWLRLNV